MDGTTVSLVGAVGAIGTGAGDELAIGGGVEAREGVIGVATGVATDGDGADSLC